MAQMHPLIIIVPVNTIPIDIIPIDIIPKDITPMDSILTTLVFMTMDPVTNHPIGKVPKITITWAMTHLLCPQKKEVQNRTKCG
ncbi:hypothetical protein QTO34_014617 [Cnephaeus nilssonii]|uniref:Uncharacterized protein n=1 Tax=Cnephaeus nilssonii TaxID=3371016 RepID=A0AA40I6P5_CNENI|nr:hypothetical protein QTO34_014617 [Eptesicus nilssonii]